jgi:hypothetical protein
VDDCSPSGKYDGAYEAYVDFAREIDAPVDIRFGKIGVIRLAASEQSPREEMTAGDNGHA